jgi:Ni,Fe-hydrogenase III component G
MTQAVTIEQLQTQLNGSEWSSPENNRYDGSVTAEKLLDTVKTLRNLSTFYLAAITGMDDGAAQNTLQVLYHFCAGAVVVTLRVTLQRSQAVIPSLCAIIPYASPFERETAEMFGIIFTDAPDTLRLFLPDDWTEGVYPMRKDAIIEGIQHDNTD